MAEQARQATSNSLGLLTGYMFEEMDKLSEIDINADPEVLEAEVKRAKALGETAKIIVENAQVILEATRMRADFMGTNVKVPRELDG